MYVYKELSKHVIAHSYACCDSNDGNRFFSSLSVRCHHDSELWM